MGHATTRPHDGLRACRAARRRASGEPIDATRIRDGYATAMRTVFDALQQASRRMCCNFPKAARERLVELAGLRLMPPPRTSC